MQYSLCLVVAAVRALVSGSLAGNAWLIHPRDEEVDAAPHADGAPDPALTFPCTGVHYADGSMADDVTLNWIVTSIAAIAQSRRHPIPLDDAQIAFAGEIFRLTEGLPTVREVERVLGSVHLADGTPYALARLPDVSLRRCTSAVRRGVQFLSRRRVAALALPDAAARRERVARLPPRLASGVLSGQPPTSPIPRRSLHEDPAGPAGGPGAPRHARAPAGAGAGDVPL